MDQVKIFCPKCKWVPQPSNVWVCEPACGSTWNTFATNGVCPQCGKFWEETQCQACHQWSRHGDWYHEPDPEDAQQAREQTRVE